MARIARVVVPGLPHHVTQRGNRRQPTFFCDRDYEAYIDLMAEWCRRRGVDIWAWCLMPNHVHLIAVPSTEDSLRGALGEAHRRYTRMINFREEWRGHLWQERFASFPLEGTYLLAAARYIEWNPVRAGLVKDPVKYPWSSAKGHVRGKDDALATVAPLLDLVHNWKSFLLASTSVCDEELRVHSRTGRPLGSPEFVGGLETRLGRTLVPLKPGPKPRKGNG